MMVSVMIHRCISPRNSLYNLEIVLQRMIRGLILLSICVISYSFTVPSMIVQTKTALSATINKYENELVDTANKLSLKGKGILAMDESIPTMGKRLQAIGLENKECHRKSYRGKMSVQYFCAFKMLFTHAIIFYHVDNKLLITLQCS